MVRCSRWSMCIVWSVWPVVPTNLIGFHKDQHVRSPVCGSTYWLELRDSRWRLEHQESKFWMGVAVFIFLKRFNNLEPHVIGTSVMLPEALWQLELARRFLFRLLTLDSKNLLGALVSTSVLVTICFRAVVLRRAACQWLYLVTSSNYPTLF